MLYYKIFSIKQYPGELGAEKSKEKSEQHYEVVCNSMYQVGPLGLVIDSYSERARERPRT